MKTQFWGLGILDQQDEPWFIESDVNAIPMTLDKPINETPVALSDSFLIGHRKYSVVAQYDPRSGRGSLRLEVEKN